MGVAWQPLQIDQAKATYKLCMKQLPVAIATSSYDEGWCTAINKQQLQHNDNNNFYLQLEEKFTEKLALRNYLTAQKQGLQQINLTLMVLTYMIKLITPYISN